MSTDVISQGLGSFEIIGMDIPENMEEFALKVLKEKIRSAQIIIDKQQDYGPHNINKFGDHGVLVRTSDKIERLANLYASQKDPLHESVDDSWDDTENYATIAKLYRKGDWPK